MDIGETIKNQRKNKNLTQKQLADKIGKSERMVQKYENGEVIPSIEVLKKIGLVIGLFVFDFRDDLKNDSDNNIIKNQDYVFEQYLLSIGYEIIHDRENNSIRIKFDEKEYEITQNDIEDIKSSLKSFVRYKCHDIVI